MPNRILRDWTDSDRVDLLSAEAERFFVRLIMKADDYGRYFADPKRLKAFLFPLKDTLRETDISRWLAECEKAGLIRFYDASGKRYVELQKFGQRLRNMRHLHPSPQTAASGGESPPESETNLNPNQKRIEYRRVCGAKLEKLFGRTEIDVWSYAEESTLFELQKRPGFDAELDIIEGFHAKNAPYFPQSLTSLLMKWSETLDRARNYERNRRNDSPTGTAGGIDKVVLNRNLTELEASLRRLSEQYEGHQSWSAADIAERKRLKGLVEDVKTKLGIVK